MKHRLFAIGSFAGYMLIDFATIAFSIMASYKIYRVLELGKQVFYPKLGIIPLSLSLSLGVVFILFLFGAYKNESSLLNVSEIKSVVKGISLGFLLLSAVLMFGRIELSRYVLFFSYVSSLLLVMIERSVLYHILPLTKTAKGWNRRILIYGAGELGSALFRAIANSPKLGILPIGFVDDNPEKADTIHCSSSFSSTSCVLPVLGTGNDIGGLIKQYRIDEICLAISNISNETCIKILERLKKEYVRISFIPNLYKVLVHRVNINHIGQIPIVEENDARVTHVGRFLRKTSLAELPQLFNVLKSDMSFVGPRPEMPFIVETYSDIH